MNNKYYSAEVALFVHQTVKEALDSMKSYEALVILCNLSKVSIKRERERVKGKKEVGGLLCSKGNKNKPSPTF